jgi:hypothetical protein
MKKTGLVGPLLILLALASLAKGVGTIMNGSFEDDGSIDFISVQEPNGWDVNIPNTDEFDGCVLSYWPTGGSSYNLTLYSQSGGSFEANDIATVSQTVDLTDANEVIFDLKLGSLGGAAWDPAKITAVVLIDGDVVWESNSVGPDVSGEYFGQVYEVNDIYLDGEAHVLSLGLRVNLTIPFLTDFFMSHWDFVTLDVFCDGLGLVPGDIDRDCYVDVNDVRELGQVWLQETGAGSRYNLYPDANDPNGLVNFRDYCVLAENWLASSYD